MIEELYWEGDRLMRKRTLPSGTVIISDITIKERGPRKTSTRDLVLRLCEKLGVAID